mgnify:CR=1 FL=1
MTCISPLENGTCTRSTTIEVNGTEVKMHVDISLDGNTGVPTFTTQQPDKLRNFIASLTADFSAFPRETHFIDKPVRDEELVKAIIEDKDGVVKDAYDEVISSVNEQIETEGGNVDVFEQRIAENTSEGEEITDGLKNQNLLDNDEEVSGDGESDDTNVEPAEIIAPNFIPKIPLVYPMDMLIGDNRESQDYIFFEQFQYSPPNPLEGKMLTDAGMDMEQGNTQINSVENVLKFGVRRETNIKEAYGTCTLPIPNKLGVSNGVSWGEARANAVELAGFSAANKTIRDQLENFDLGQLLKSGIQGTGDTLNELKEQIRDPNPNSPDAGSIISATLAKAVLSKLNINVDIDQFITRQTGAALNPNLELLFGGPQLRTFSFNFDFAPNTAKEADVVRQIQRWFKQGMLPARSGTTGRPQSLFLGSPNVFRIAYKNRGRRIKSLNVIKICALTTCQIDFTPDGTYQSYEDTRAFSQPVRSTMGLTFNELTPIFRDDYGTPQGENFVVDPSISDLGTNLTGDNAISDTDIGF